MKQTSRNDIVVISNTASQALACRVDEELPCALLNETKMDFSDGEIYHVFPNNVAGKDIVIVGATHDDAAHQEVLDLIDGCHYHRVNTITLVVPYLGYSTMERTKHDLYEIPKGITRTRQLYRARPGLVIFIDLHSESVLNAHCGDVHTMHLQTDEILVEKIHSLGLSNYVLVSPDYGRSKWVARLASKLGVAHTAADKDRYAMDETMVGQVSGVVNGKTVIICDDMIRTGGSIIQTALRCREAGAKETLLFATHLVLSGNSRQCFMQNGIKKIIGADTYPDRKSDNLLDIYSVAPLIVDALEKQLRIIG